MIRSPQSSSSRLFKADRSISAMAAVTGLITIVLGLVMMQVFPPKTQLEDGFKTPILAFEFAETADDLAFLAGAEPDTVVMREAMNRGHRWDMVYPFAYGGVIFLILLGHGLRGSPAGWVGLPVMFGTVIADLWENLVLLEITKVLAAGDTSVVGQELFSQLHLATWAKWGGLGVGLLLLAFCELKARQWIGGAVTFVPSVLIALSWLSNADGTIVEIMALSLIPTYIFLTFRACLRVSANWARNQPS